MQGRRWLQWNKGVWEVFEFPNGAIQLTNHESASISEVHTLYRALLQCPEVLDVVMGYTSLTILSRLPFYRLVSFLEGLSWEVDSNKGVEHVIPVCYELGSDWEHLEIHIGLSRGEMIEKHQASSYQVAFIGFMPGFVYTSGMDPSLTIPKKTTPSIRQPIGSVAIGGDQTGIYSLPSPGGWHVVGRTPLMLFNSWSLPPLRLVPGDAIRFESISMQRFQSWDD